VSQDSYAITWTAPADRAMQPAGKGRHHGVERVPGGQPARRSNPGWRDSTAPDTANTGVTYRINDHRRRADLAAIEHRVQPGAVCPGKGVRTVAARRQQQRLKEFLSRKLANGLRPPALGWSCFLT